MVGATLSNISSSMRVASVQYAQRSIASFDAFHDQMAWWVASAAAQQADFVVLPELFTLQLLSLPQRGLGTGEALAILSHYTFKTEKSLRRLATRHHINIVGGSHLVTRPNGQVENVCMVALRDGSLHHQPKTRIPAYENQQWSTVSGHPNTAIDTDCGRFGILIGQDIESPELARRLVNQGAEMLFTPYCTAQRGQYLRLRQAAQARALENDVYVILSGNTGHMQGVNSLGSLYAHNAILSPCDFTYSHDGIINEAEPNLEMQLVADLHLDALREKRTASPHSRHTLAHIVSLPTDLFTARSHHKRVTQAHPHAQPPLSPAALAYNSPTSASGHTYS
jgi:predicted amidohydrolase